MKRINLKTINNSLLESSQMSNLTGGATKKTGNCTCGCQYESSGGSSTGSNATANSKGDLNPPKGVPIKKYVKAFLTNKH